MDTYSIDKVLNSGKFTSAYKAREDIIVPANHIAAFYISANNNDKAVFNKMNDNLSDALTKDKYDQLVDLISEATIFSLVGYAPKKITPLTAKIAEWNMGEGAPCTKIYKDRFVIGYIFPLWNTYNAFDKHLRTFKGIIIIGVTKKAIQSYSVGLCLAKHINYIGKSGLLARIGLTKWCVLFPFLAVINPKCFNYGSDVYYIDTFSYTGTIDIGDKTNYLFTTANGNKPVKQAGIFSESSLLVLFLITLVGGVEWVKKKMSRA